ncbi:MAG: MarP family serine protease [Acidimicrobiales bacterium]
MDGLDVLVVSAAVGAAVLGFRLGFLARIVSWIGLAAGFYLAARLVPRLVRVAGLGSASSRLLFAFLVLIAGTAVGYGVGLLAGARLQSALPPGPARFVDRGVGAAAGVAGVLVALWLLVPTLTTVAGWPARATQQSAIAGWVSSHLPIPPDVFQALRREVGQEGFPQVFQNLTQGPSGPVVPPAGSPLSAATTRAVAASTVRVQGQACSRILDGSGFAVAPGLVATNAHVVAGEPPGSTEVLSYDGRTLRATVVAFDPNRDLALLAVPGLAESPLPLAAGSPGEAVAAFGHPQGQVQLAVTPASIHAQIQARGTNLYGSASTTRSVLVLAAVLQPGDSGSPVVTPGGLVVGVVFAIAEGEPNVAYALASQELQAVLAAPRSAAVPTRSCLAG